jgi:hypothetical protein
VKKDLAEHDYNALDEVLLRVLARGRARPKCGGDVDGVFWYTKHVHYTLATSCASLTVRSSAHGAKPGLPRLPPHASSRHQHPPARMLRVLRRHDVTVAPANARDRCGLSAGMQCASPRDTCALQHNDSRPGRGTLGLRTVLPHRFAWRRDGLHRQRQRQHDDAQGSPWPPRLSCQGP